MRGGGCRYMEIGARNFKGVVMWIFLTWVVLFLSVLATLWMIYVIIAFPYMSPTGISL